jgi:hypothetical protein
MVEINKSLQLVAGELGVVFSDSYFFRFQMSLIISVDHVDRTSTITKTAYYGVMNYGVYLV